MQLPQDEAPHQTPDEWWYFSGHLLGVDPAGHVHSYGFEYVTFKFLNSGQPPVYFGNFAVTDLTRRTFQYDVRPDSYPVPNAVNSFSLHTQEWTMSGGSGSDTLHADIPGYTMDLKTQTTEPAALHGSNGVIPFGPLGTSDYYSWTSLHTSGTITDHGVPVKVTGLSWMDHQWGAFNLASGAGWDWHSIQLSNGQQYMLYFIRDASGAIVQTLGTRVDKGQTTNLDPSAFSEATTGSWTSPATGITYGSGWRVTLPGGYLTVSPDLVNSELNLASTQGVVYWEGDTAVHGVINGQPVAGAGYTEINPTG
ncbi:MAG: carotenoid 1,2-hydratase [Actinomycetia bacterium]|nr:carotenoid 1,2-hydratase [Actinomycetes bacterium]